MVYCGKPSRGCQMCRTRRIKCDETKPACLQCQKSRRQCPGYREDFDLVFRNKTKALERRFRRSTNSKKIKSKSEQRNCTEVDASASASGSVTQFCRAKRLDHIFDHTECATVGNPLSQDSNVSESFLPGSDAGADPSSWSWCEGFLGLAAQSLEQVEQEEQGFSETQPKSTVRTLTTSDEIVDRYDLINKINGLFDLSRVDTPKPFGSHIEETDASLLEISEDISSRPLNHDDVFGHRDKRRMPIAGEQHASILQLLRIYHFQLSMNNNETGRTATSSVTCQGRGVRALGPVAGPDFCYKKACSTPSEVTRSEDEPLRRSLVGDLKARRALMGKLHTCLDYCRVLEAQCNKLHHHDPWSLLKDPQETDDKALVHWTMTVNEDPDFDPITIRPEVMRNENTIRVDCEGIVPTFCEVDRDISENSGLKGHQFLTSFLDTARKALLDKLMQEVWLIFDKKWTANFTTCAGSAASSSTTPGGSTSTSGGRSVPKRRRQDDDDDNSSGQNNGRNPKRAPPDKKPLGGNEYRLQLACPFRKHDPQKYCFPKYRACARSSWDCVGRVKEHIYRLHRAPIHCTRCWMTFASQELLNSHSREETNAGRCQVKPKAALDGITIETEQLVKCRKKDYPDQSEPELWKKLYRILFPNEIVPSPYFEADLDQNANQLDQIERDNYDAYCRRELPRVIRSHLESTVASQLRAIEWALRAQLDGIVEKSLEQVSVSYQALRATATFPSGNESSLPAPISIRLLCPPTPTRLLDGSGYSNEVQNVSEFEPISHYFGDLGPRPGQQVAPAGLTMHEIHGQPDDMFTEGLSFENAETLMLNSNSAHECFCPVDACNCPRQPGCEKEQEYCLPPAAFQLKGPAKMPATAPLLNNWNPDDFLVGAGSDIDEINFDGEDLLLRHGRV